MTDRRRGIWQEFPGWNQGYVLALYERYRQDPAQVDAATRAIFDRWAPPAVEAVERAALPQEDHLQIVAVANLAQAIRSFGHLDARLDPLGSPPPGDPSLHPDFHHLDEEILRQLPASLVGEPVATGADSAWEGIQALREIYCARIGYDYEHIRVPEEREWLREAAEGGRFRPPRTPLDEVGLLHRLTEVEVFERFLHRIFPGKTRFSIEGLDLLVPILDEVVAETARSEICMILIGMAHRGRLNVLAHVLGKPYAQILAEFKDPGVNFHTRDELGWQGDVKYHKGARRAVEENQHVELVIVMPSNPSHLEHINPVVEGMARAADSQVDHPGAPRFHPRAALPVLIHGDASFTGEGVVAETLNLGRLAGYHTAGTVHIIANNQLGFTATDAETRSTLYASDLAKGFKIPVIHVNADDPIACIEAARTAMAYRARFQKDFLIDLIGYRRYGHNEGDEPAFTQPLMYATIDDHPTVRRQWADRLVEEGQLEAELPETLVQEGLRALQQVNEGLEPEEDLVEPIPKPPPRGAAARVDTAVSMERLRALNEALLTLPERFHLHPKMGRAMERRREVLADPGEASLDWATAEELAFASILEDGTAIRLTGQDVARGTFSQRHAVFTDVETGETHTPLAALRQAGAAFEVHNSPLTENAVVAFEFGYNSMNPERLVLWEAQYGDFANVAQVMIDEFLTSARTKWGLTPSLVLLLPHGNEGQGPDHASARPERYLALAAEINLRIANPTTAAQYFHLLRRQAALLKTDPLPLVVLTPKGLLRHPLTASRPRDLAEGSWRPVLEEAEGVASDQARRLLLCSGRVYIDLATDENRKEYDRVAIARLEQLYPFPEEAMKDLLDRYPRVEQVVWVQEEPRNMGAWRFVEPCLRALLPERPLFYVGRPPSSSPAEGSTAWYRANQQALVSQAFEPELEPPEDAESRITVAGPAA